MCIWTTGLTGVHNTMEVQRMKTEWKKNEKNEKWCTW